MNSELLIPNHIAVIMDGNARWAKKRELSQEEGHKKGIKSIEILIESAIEFKVKYLTIYAFSTENWNRPENEVKYLMNLAKIYLKNDIEKLDNNGVKILVSGDLSRVDNYIRTKILKAKKITKNNSNLILNIAFNYGSRQEITSAFKKIAIDIKKEKININDINETIISNYLYNPNIPDPDLLIRTAGEIRLSNFMLWQLIYTELYFTKILWPDFTKDELYKAILAFNNRNRKYGKRNS